MESGFTGMLLTGVATNLMNFFFGIFQKDGSYRPNAAVLGTYHKDKFEHIVTSRII